MVHVGVFLVSADGHLRGLSPHGRTAKELAPDTTGLDYEQSDIGGRGNTLSAPMEKLVGGLEKAGASEWSKTMASEIQKCSPPFGVVWVAWAPHDGDHLSPPCAAALTSPSPFDMENAIYLNDLVSNSQVAQCKGLGSQLLKQIVEKSLPKRVQTSPSAGPNGNLQKLESFYSTHGFSRLSGQDLWETQEGNQEEIVRKGLRPAPESSTREAWRFGPFLVVVVFLALL